MAKTSSAPAFKKDVVNPVNPEFKLPKSETVWHADKITNLELKLSSEISKLSNKPLSSAFLFLGLKLAKFFSILKSPLTSP